MGGDEPARTLIAAALGAGKPVVTANKHVVAHHGPELEAVARRAGVPFRFEAAVGGGIPVLGPLAADLAGNEIDRVRGIVNGTTNYILTAMAHEGRPYDEVLADAQELGLRRGRPDRRRRGRRRGQQAGHPRPARVRALARPDDRRPACPEPARRRAAGHHRRDRPGARGRGGARADDQAARDARRARRTGIEAAVVPTAVPADSPFGWTDGVTNRIEIDAEPLGTGRAGRAGRRRARRPAARSSATSWRSPAASARPGPASPPATGPAIAADDPLDGRAPLVRVHRADRATSSLPAAPATTRRRSTSRTGRPSGRRSRRWPTPARRLAPILPDDADATLYPVDD